MTILETYRTMHAHSWGLYNEAQTLFPTGITHDARLANPFPLYVERSTGAYKWDVDGNRLIDYWSGHGALLLGHAHPDVVAAVQSQIACGTHLGAESPLALRWGRLVQQLFPSIERLRFTASGTEAAMLAVRLARVYTGRSAIVRFVGHFHGWSDSVARGSDGMDVPTPGVHAGVLDATIVLPPDLNRVEQIMQSRADVAAVILEPTGASYGTVPMPDSFLRELREMTQRYGVLLICDEVVTGFRITPGGAQQQAGIQADLTILAKILAGGLPGGAVGGRADIMRHLAFGDEDWSRERKIRHNGTFNANPLSAAAGIATLALVASGAPGTQAALMGQRLTDGLNDVLRERKLWGWAAYGNASIVHVIVGSSVPFAPGELSPDVPSDELKQGGDRSVMNLLRLALVNRGVDFMRGKSAFLSLAHTAADIIATIRAFSEALDDIAAEQCMPSN